VIQCAAAAIRRQLGRQDALRSVLPILALAPILAWRSAGRSVRRGGRQAADGGGQAAATPTADQWTDRPAAESRPWSSPSNADGATAQRVRARRAFVSDEAHECARH